jgi:hypothetical protein
VRVTANVENRSTFQNHPHPNPLPEYRERGPDSVHHPLREAERLVPLAAVVSCDALKLLIFATGDVASIIRSSPR